MKRIPFVLIFLSSPLSLLMSMLLTLIEIGIGHLVLGTKLEIIWSSLYPVVSIEKASIFFFITFNLISLFLLWERWEKRKASSQDEKAESE